MDYSAKLNMKQVKNIQSEYKFLKKVGSGAFGEVYTAHSRHDNEKLYAIKILDKKKVLK